jgi:hypothetical protein
MGDVDTFPHPHVGRCEHLQEDLELAWVLGFIYRPGIIKLENTMKNVIFWDVTPRGSCNNRLSKELSASIIRVTRIGELGTLARFL